MRTRPALVLPLAAAALALSPASPASAAATSPLTVTFDNDAPGVYPNPFSSVDAPAARFSSTVAPSVIVTSIDGTSNNIIATGSPDTGALRIELPALTNRMSVQVGYDFGSPGDRAWLTTFRGATLVARTSVVLNGNGLVDQVLVQDKGPLFDRATVQYTGPGTTPGTPLAAYEVVDSVTVNPLCTIVGTAGRDTLSGTPGDDVICGDGGNDLISAGAGNDVVFAGPGNDTVDGGPGLDQLVGGLGNDVLLGRDGADTLRGLEGDDRLEGGVGTDRCEGGTGTDTGLSCEVRTQIP